LLALKATISGTPQPLEEAGQQAETTFNPKAVSTVSP
jgi:hypothetical protein